MRIKLGAVDKNGKLHKRASVSRFYSHCVVIHFAAHPPSKFWPKGVTAYSRAEWAGSRALAERSASRWHKEPYVGHRDPRGETSVIPFPKVRSHELPSCFNWLTLTVAGTASGCCRRRGKDDGRPAIPDRIDDHIPRNKHRAQFVDRLAYAAR